MPEPTLRDFHEFLGSQLEDHGDRPVRFTYQSNYPLQDHIDSVWADGDDEESPFYLVSGGQVNDDPYGPRAAFSDEAEMIDYA